MPPHKDLGFIILNTEIPGFLRSGIQIESMKKIRATRDIFVEMRVVR